jgi:CheY-like chemotaxis protein
MDADSLPIEDLLKVGLGATFDSNPTKEGSKRQSCVVRGWDIDRYILVDVLGVDGRMRVLSQNQMCIVRFLSGGIACAFQAAALHSNVMGGRQEVRLSWPSEIQRVQFRKHERIDVNILGTITLDDGTEFGCVIEDISCDGCGVVSEREIAAEASIALTCTLPDGGIIDHVPLYIRSNRPDGMGGAVLGCQFSASDHATRRDVEFLVFSMTARLREPSTSQGHVLFVDPKPSEIESLVKHLEDGGMGVSVLSDIVDGLFQMRLTPPDVLFLCASQDSISGIDLCTIVRRSRGFESLPVFIYGAPTADAKDQAAEAGATGFVDPLADAGEIARLIAKQLRGGAAEE